MKSMKLRALHGAVLSAILMGMGSNAMADSTDDLLRVLRDKGVLSDQEFNEFNTSRDAEKVKKLSEVKASFKDGIVFENSDKSVSFAVGGRIHADFRSFNNNLSDKTADAAANLSNANRESDTFDIRRSRIELKGRFYDAYEILISTDLAGTNQGNTTSVLDQAYLNINWWPEVQFRFGQFKAPMNLEKVTSSNFIDFQERSWVNQLAPNEDRGAMIWGLPATGVTYAFAVTNGEGAKNRNNADARVDGFEYIGRATVNFGEIFGDKSKQVFHLGAAGSYSKLAKSNTNAGNGWLSGTNDFRTESRGANILTLPVLTGVANVSNEIERKRYGVEAVVAQGPVKFQAEWLRNKFEGDTSVTADFNNNIDAWYAEALWLITGESYANAYKDGAFGNIKPKNDFVHPTAAFNNGDWGAWEVGVRYSKLDASDFKNLFAAANPTGSGARTFEADTWTYGLKWILNANTRFMLNYVYTDFDTPLNLGGKLRDNEKAITARAQWNF